MRVIVDDLPNGPGAFGPNLIFVGHKLRRSQGASAGGSRMTLTSTQLAWLASKKLTLTVMPCGTVDVRPTGANVWFQSFTHVRQDNGVGPFQVIQTWVTHTYGSSAPAGRVVSTHATLKAALAALVG